METFSSKTDSCDPIMIAKFILKKPSLNFVINVSNRLRELNRH